MGVNNIGTQQILFKYQANLRGSSFSQILDGGGQSWSCCSY